ncbi:MAG: pimeloyl-ACP methyl ester carboxylesterase [Candidatus Azotimanducaceae bacterium]|jgi:pimeloyl-ACP methyl ester carboxylesterase
MKVFKYVGVGLAALVLIGAALLYKGDMPAEIIDAKYASDASQFLNIASGARVHFRDEGNPGGQPVVLIHGSNASLHTWEAWRERLGDDFRIITLDLPGHGLTGRVPDDDYSPAGFTTAIDAVVNHIGVDSFVLGGNSMGGGATWRYALAHPEKVSAMILIDASGPPQWRREQIAESDPDKNSRPIVFTLLGKPWFRALMRYVDPYLLTEQGVKAAHNNSPVVDQKLIDRYYELSIRDGTRDATLHRFASYDPNANETVDVSVLTQPTLIMWGVEDGLIPVSVADKFEAVLPNSRKILYKDVGHVPMEEIPARSADDVRTFLSRLTIEDQDLGF